MIISPKVVHREDVLTVFKNQTPVAWYTNLAKPSNCYSHEPPPFTLYPHSVSRFEACRRTNRNDKLLTYAIGYQCLILNVLFKFYIRLHYAKANAGSEPQVDKRCTQECLEGVMAKNIPLTAQVFEVTVICAHGGPSTEATNTSEWLIHPIVTIRLTAIGEEFVNEALDQSRRHLHSTLHKWTTRLMQPAVGASVVDHSANPREIEKFYLDEPSRARDGSETAPSAVCAKINDRSSELVQYLWDVPLYVLYYSLAQALAKNSPTSFTPCMENEDWRGRLSQKRMSIYGRIINNTKYKLVFDKITDVVDCTLIGWPAPVICPLGFTEFGVGTGRFNVRSISCEFVYLIVGRDGCHSGDRIILTSKLSSSQPSPKMKGHAVNVDYPDSHYPLRVDICQEAVNAATIIFRIQDPNSSPYLTIIECRPSVLAPGKWPRLPCCGRADFADQMKLWQDAVTNATSSEPSSLSRQFSLPRLSPRKPPSGYNDTKSQLPAPSTNLVTLISKRLITEYANRERLELGGTILKQEQPPSGVNQDAEPNVIALANGLWWTDIVTNMCSAKRFSLPPLKQILIDAKIINCPSTPSTLGSGGSRIDVSHDPSSTYKSALLRYKIGCEVFSRILDIQDWSSIVFNTSVPGGIAAGNLASNDTQQVLLGTELVRLDNLLPAEYIPELSSWLKRLLKGELGGANFKEQYKLHYLRSEIEVNAKTAHAILFLVSKVLQEYVMKLHTRFEDKRSSLGDSPPRLTEIQSALEYTYSHWAADFAAKFPESPSLFDPIKNLASYWLSQDLEAITPTKIADAMASATIIADRLGRQDVIESLKTIIEDPVNRGLSWLSKTVVSH